MNENEFDKISLKDWRKYALGEYVRGYKTDEFYCQLANDLYEILRPASGVGIIPSENMHLLCVRLSQYVEDVVSELGIFQAFRDLNKSLDGRVLPFYNVEANTAKGSEKYGPKTLNTDDIRLLIWDFVMAFNQKKEIPSPFNPDYLRLALELKVIMDDALKNAPANSALYDWLYPYLHYDSYDNLRERMLWMCRGCYLSASYHYESELEEVTKMLNEAKVPQKKNFRRFKNTPAQTRKGIIEMLVFQKTTRLLSLPYHQFYAQMLLSRRKKKNAEIVGDLDGYIFQEYKVEKVQNKHMVIESVDLKKFDIEISFDFSIEVDRPENLRFVMCSLVKFKGQWQISCCRSYAYHSDFLFVRDDGWDEDVMSYQEQTKRAKLTSESVLKLQKEKEMGFYRNPQIFTLRVMEVSRTKMIENLKAHRDSTTDLYIKRQITDQINALTRQVKEIGRSKQAILSRTPLEPMVAMVHDDGYTTVYRNYINDLQIAENPFARNIYSEKVTKEYKILYGFEYFLACIVLRDPSLPICDNEESDKCQNVRRFLVDNVEFITRYCYHDNFTSKSSQSYIYPGNSVCVM